MLGVDADEASLDDVRAEGLCRAIPRNAEEQQQRPHVASLHGEHGFLSSRNHSMSQGAQKGLLCRSGCWHKRGATVRLEGNALCTKSRVHNVCTTIHIASPVDSTVQSSDLFSIRTRLQVKKVCISSDSAGNGPATAWRALICYWQPDPDQAALGRACNCRQIVRELIPIRGF